MPLQFCKNWQCGFYIMWQSTFWYIPKSWISVTPICTPGTHLSCRYKKTGVLLFPFQFEGYFLKYFWSWSFPMGAVLCVTFLVLNNKNWPWHKPFEGATPLGSLALSLFYRWPLHLWLPWPDSSTWLPLLFASVPSGLALGSAVTLSSRSCCFMLSYK